VVLGPRRVVITAGAACVTDDSWRRALSGDGLSGMMLYAAVLRPAGRGAFVRVAGRCPDSVVGRDLRATPSGSGCVFSERSWARLRRVGAGLHYTASSN